MQEHIKEEEKSKEKKTRNTAKKSKTRQICQNLYVLTQLLCNLSS